MATIEERVTALEATVQTHENRITKGAKKLGKLIRRLKAIIKHIKPMAIPSADAFDPWMAKRRQDAIAAKWVILAEDEDEEL